MHSDTGHAPPTQFGPSVPPQGARALADLHEVALVDLRAEPELVETVRGFGYRYRKTS